MRIRIFLEALVPFILISKEITGHGGSVVGSSELETAGSEQELNCVQHNN